MTDMDWSEYCKTSEELRDRYFLRQIKQQEENFRKHRDESDEVYLKKFLECS